jgi:hypothetical protein
MQATALGACACARTGMRQCTDARECACVFTCDAPKGYYAHVHMCTHAYAYAYARVYKYAQAYAPTAVDAYAYEPTPVYAHAYTGTDMPTPRQAHMAYLRDSKMRARMHVQGAHALMPMCMHADLPWARMHSYAYAYV